MSVLIFISYANADSAEAEEMQAALTEAGFRTFLAKKDIAGGEHFSQAIRNALQEALEVCLLMSPNSIKSEWVISEWGAAWVLGKRITPIILRCSPAALPQRLAQLQAIDYHVFSRYVQELRQRSENLERRFHQPDTVERSELPESDWQLNAYPPMPFPNEAMTLTIVPSSSALKRLPVSITCQVLDSYGNIAQTFNVEVSYRAGHSVNFTPQRLGAYTVRWVDTATNALIGELNFNVQIF